MAVYRNQTSTMSQIAMLSRMRITTTTEAVAYLGAVQPLNEQVAAVLQTASLRRQQAINRASTPTPEPPVQGGQEIVQESVQEDGAEKRFQPEDLSSDEGYSESEIEARVNTLKSTKLNSAKANKAQSKTQKRKNAMEEKSKLKEDK